MPSIRDFSGGVLNQELLGKDNGAGIIIDARNVLSSWNGEIRKRTGTRIISQLEKKSRIIPYRLPNNDDALLVFTDGNVKGYELSDAGITTLMAKPDLVELPKEGWVVGQDYTSATNGDWLSNNTLGLTWGTTESLTSLGWFATKFAAGGWLGISNVNPFCIKNISFNCFNSTANNVAYVYPKNPVLQYSDDNDDWHIAKSSFTQKDTFHPGGGLFGGHAYSTKITITNSDVFQVHKYWRVVFTDAVSAEELITVTMETELVGSATTSFEATTDFLEEDLTYIKFAQSGNDIYIVSNKKNPFRIKNSATGIEAGDFVPENTAGVWTENGCPSCVSSFQNRLVFSGFESYKNRVIMSEFGNFDNFTVKDTDVLPTDPISADCVELRSEIENLWAGNNALYALSSDGVSMLDAQGGIVATDQINFKLRNREPADGMTPTTKDDIMIYLGNDRRKIFITDYDFIVQRFKAKDLSIGYNGFLTSRIVAMHYASRKCSLIYGYHDNGDLLTLLFDPDLPKNALFPCNIGGEIKDMQVFKSGDKFRVLMVVQVEDRWYLVEKNEQPDYQLMDFMSEQEKQAYTDSVIRNGYYLDLMTQRFYESPVDIIEDVPYAVGEQVAVFADGKYIGEKICSAGGPYAWVNGTDLVYTRKNLPQSGDELLDKDELPLEDKRLVKYEGNKIYVEERSIDIIASVDYYGWKYFNSITGNTVGTLERNPDGDGTQAVRGGAEKYKFGWGNYFTGSPVSAIGNGICTGAWTRQDVIASVDKVVFYTKKQRPEVGDDVYNVNFEVIGQISEIGVTNTGDVDSPTAMTHILVNDKYLYVSSEDNTKHEELVPSYKNVEYSRSVIDDLASGPVGVRLDEPAKSFLLGYNYDAYFVIKMATPYSQIKYPKEISTYFINTGYVEMGNSFDNLQPILNNLVDKLDIFDKPIFINGEYTKTMDKMDKSPYIIFRSKMPMPFMITGIDFKVDYSNYQGGI